MTKILFAHKEKMLLETSQEVLNMCGYDNVFSTNNALSALEMFESERPEVVFIDVDTWENAPFNLSKALLQIDPHVALVGLTQFYDPDYLNKLSEAGFNLCLRIIYHKEELLKATEEAVNIATAKRNGSPLPAFKIIVRERKDENQTGKKPDRRKTFRSPHQGAEKFLIACHNDMTLDSLEDWFHDIGYATMAANNYEDAIDLNKTERPKVALLDLSSNEINAISLAERMLHENPDIILLGIRSLHFTPAEQGFLEDIGFSACMGMPVKPECLTKTVANAFKNADAKS
ncbi:MAG: response regulator [Desulfatibacillum sp.]|nr:response regulator [Desulfatibacillum sp.]